MKTIRVSVTADDIEKGITHSAQRSPISYAIARILQIDNLAAQVFSEVVILCKGQRAETVPLPDSVQAFTWAYDAGCACKPFEFELTLKSGLFK